MLIAALTCSLLAAHEIRVVLWCMGVIMTRRNMNYQFDGLLDELCFELETRATKIYQMSSQRIRMSQKFNAKRKFDSPGSVKRKQTMIR